MSDETPELPKLSGPTLEPLGGRTPKQLVILCHGVGSDGDDLMGLAPFFQKVLPDARFVSPHAPFQFDGGPVGYQWFSLQDFSDDARKEGVRKAAPILNKYIDEQLAALGLGHGGAADTLLAVDAPLQAAAWGIEIAVRHPTSRATERLQRLSLRLLDRNLCRSHHGPQLLIRM